MVIIIILYFIIIFYLFLSAFRSVVGKNVTLKATSLVKSEQMLLAAELPKSKRIQKTSKLKCFKFASNCELKIAITNYV
jgi:hypothetical protein